MKVTLIQQTPEPINTIARIASICYDSDPKNPLVLVKHLYNNGHTSVFEHIYFTWKIEGISRACSHQLVRHRLCSFTQRSQRYCDEDSFAVVRPESISSEDQKQIWDKTISTIRAAYDVLCGMVPKEDARFILPNACETEIYMSCNLRELINIANLRLCSRAQWEIRNLVAAMVNSVSPELRWMLVPKCQSGNQICKTPCEFGGK